MWQARQYNIFELWQAQQFTFSNKLDNAPLNYQTLTIFNFDAIKKKCKNYVRIRNFSVTKSNAADTTKPLAEAPGMNGPVEVLRPPNATVSVFEFGSVVASNDKVTLAGYCPVSENFEPCRWEIIQATQSNAPQFRVFFFISPLSYTFSAYAYWIEFYLFLL